MRILDAYNAIYLGGLMQESLLWPGGNTLIHWALETLWDAHEKSWLALLSQKIEEELTGLNSDGKRKSEPPKGYAQSSRASLFLLFPIVQQLYERFLKLWKTDKKFKDFDNRGSRRNSHWEETNTKGVLNTGIHVEGSGPGVEGRGRRGLFSSVQLLSCVQLVATPWTVARQASLSITNSQSLLKLMSTESVMPSNHLILFVPFSPCLQSFPASGSFQIVSSLHQVAKVLEFQLQHQSFQWTFKTDFL